MNKQVKEMIHKIVEHGRPEDKDVPNGKTLKYYINVVK